MSDTNNTVVVNSRTISLKNEFDTSLISEYNANITTMESGHVFIQCESVEISQKVFDILVENGHKVRIVSYALFFRSTDEMTEDEARMIFSSMSDINIVYARVDANGHTGKLVVDTWDDYCVFKDCEDEEKTIKFYHFDPRAKTKIKKSRKYRKYRKYRKNREESEDNESVDY